MNKEEQIKIVSERINKLLHESGRSGRWICREVLSNYSSPSFSRFTSGKALPPGWIVQKLSEYFGVRESWLLGFDNIRTDDEMNRFNNIVNSFNEERKNSGYSMSALIEPLLSSLIRDLCEEGYFEEIKNQYIFLNYIEDSIKQSTEQFKKYYNK